MRLLNLSKFICVTTMSLLGASLISGIPAQAGTVGIAYNFLGSLTAPPDLEPDGLHLQASASGPVDEFNPIVNAAWNPVTFDTMDVLDLSTGLDNGTFTWSFANGEKVFGTMFENDTAVNMMTDMGTSLQTLTFTGGTGEFVGVTGSSFGIGLITPSTFTISGNGFLTAPGLIGVPEPGSIALMLGGLVIMVFRYRRLGKRTAESANA